MSQLSSFPVSSGQGLFQENIDDRSLAERPVPGSLPGYIRVPLGKVRISEYPEPEEFEWNPAELEVQLAVEKFYESANADLETT